MNIAPQLSGFSARMAEAASLTNFELERLLSAQAEGREHGCPDRLLAAMRHALMGNGKRFRPFLVVESAQLFAVPPKDSVVAAAAVECLHTYSLVHDDLPAMDDDDLRRGRPTVHKAFDEATAILAGDALLTLAFEILAGPEAHPDGAVRARLVSVLARAAGAAGMVGGQMLDLQAENRVLDETAIRRIQAMKTGALIAAPCEMGAVLGGADAPQRSALRSYGERLGLAFQIADDLLDLESTAANLGKAAAKDAARGKATFVGLLGAEGARDLLRRTVTECAETLSPFGHAAAVLVEAARFAAERTR